MSKLIFTKKTIIITLLILGLLSIIITLIFTFRKVNKENNIHEFLSTDELISSCVNGYTIDIDLDENTQKNEFKKLGYSIAKLNYSQLNDNSLAGDLKEFYNCYYNHEELPIWNLISDLVVDANNAKYILYDDLNGISSDGSSRIVIFDGKDKYYFIVTKNKGIYSDKMSLLAYQDITKIYNEYPEKFHIKNPPA